MKHYPLSSIAHYRVGDGGALGALTALATQAAVQSDVQLRGCNAPTGSSGNGYGRGTWMIIQVSYIIKHW